MPPGASRTGSVIYLCLEELRPGQAAATHVRAIANGLRKEGWSVSLIAPPEGSEAARAGLARRLLRIFPLTFRALRALRGADIAYVRAHPLAMLFSVVARLMRKPAVHEVNGRPADLGETYPAFRRALPVIAWLQSMQYRRAAALAAVTPELAAWAEQAARSRAKAHTIPNAADTAVFHPDAAGGPAIDAPFVIFFGGLVAWHGVDVMLKALQAPGWPKAVKLVIAGRGDQSAAVDAEAARDNRLIATGFIAQRDLAGLAARALAVLVPIEHQGGRADTGAAPLKLFEGMASGRPVIVSDLPFQGALVRETGCGLVVPPSDTAALAAAVAELASDPARADEMGRAGRAAAEREHSWQARAKQTSRLLARVLEQDAF